MSDSAFPTAAFPAYTSDQLRAFIAEGAAKADAMRQELARRAAVAAGDVSQMTPAERLRRARQAEPNATAESAVVARAEVGVSDHAMTGPWRVIIARRASGEARTFYYSRNDDSRLAAALMRQAQAWFGEG